MSWLDIMCSRAAELALALLSVAAGLLIVAIAVAIVRDLVRGHPVAAQCLGAAALAFGVACLGLWSVNQRISVDVQLPLWQLVGLAVALSLTGPAMVLAGRERAAALIVLGGLVVGELLLAIGYGVVHFIVDGLIEAARERAVYAQEHPVESFFGHIFTMLGLAAGALVLLAAGLLRLAKNNKHDDDGIW